MIRKRKAVFLDRDGILIQEKGGYNYLPEDIRFLQGAAEALQQLARAGYIFIVITNQGGIARGLYSHRRLQEIHTEIKAHFGSKGVRLLDFYYCPHHPDSSLCLCRKPDSLMLEKAIARYHVDAKQSYFIGDNERDVLAGQKAGVQAILVESNADLREVVEKII